MASSHPRPLLRDDNEPEWIFFDGDNRDYKLGTMNFTMNFENQSKTDGGMIKITNDNNDNNSTSTSGNNMMKHINNSAPSRRHSKKNKIKMKTRKKQKVNLEMISEDEEENQKEIRRVSFEREQEMKFYDEAMITREEQHQQRQHQDG